MPFVVRAPSAADGVAVHDLIANCPPLDRNSLYASLVQCTDFARTCALASDTDGLLGWVSGHLIPARRDTYFLWQVAVAPAARGRGVAAALVDHILARPECAGVHFLETTITADNAASWRLFDGLAARWRAPLERLDGFDRDRHFGGRHDTEFRVRIGPLGARRTGGGEAPPFHDDMQRRPTP